VLTRVAQHNRHTRLVTLRGDRGIPFGHFFRTLPLRLPDFFLIYCVDNSTADIPGCLPGFTPPSLHQLNITAHRLLVIITVLRFYDYVCVFTKFSHFLYDYISLCGPIIYSLAVQLQFRSCSRPGRCVHYVRSAITPWGLRGPQSTERRRQFSYFHACVDKLLNSRIISRQSTGPSVTAASSGSRLVIVMM